MDINNAGLVLIDDQVYILSTKVAELFNKEHKEVICDIQNILNSDNLGGIAYDIFSKSVCYDKEQEYLEYLITERGLILLTGIYINSVPEVIEEYLDIFKTVNRCLINDKIIQDIDKRRIKTLIEVMNKMTKIKKPMIPTKVYIIKDLKNDYYKIGITSKEVDARINQLKIGNPNKMIVIYQKQFNSWQKAREIENYLHKKFNKFNVEHEWFDLDEKQIKTIIGFLKTK